MSDKKPTVRSVFANGFLHENPTFRLVLGLCPTLAVTTAAANGLGMGLATLVVLTGSNILISLLSSFVPDGIRIPAFIVVIASFTTMVSLLMQAFLPALAETLGVYIPLIVVNCIIFARAEGFACKQKVLLSAVDGIAIGLSFTLSLVVIASVREILGSGTFFGLAIPALSSEPALLFALPPGGFLVLGILMMVFGKITNRLHAVEEVSLAHE